MPYIGKRPPIFSYSYGIVIGGLCPGCKNRSLTLAARKERFRAVTVRERLYERFRCDDHKWVYEEPE